MKLFFSLFILFCLSFGVYIYADIATQPASVITTTFSETTDIPTAEIVRTNAGYSPQELVVDKGTVVIFKNQSRSFHWPASDPHPTHGEYPEFDSKHPLAPGEEWKFVFDEVGEWKFHDHIKAGIGGSVYVENPEEEAFELVEGQIMEELVE